MGFNLRDERLKDVNLRTAFAYGIIRARRSSTSWKETV